MVIAVVPERDLRREHVEGEGKQVKGGKRRRQKKQNE